MLAAARMWQLGTFSRVNIRNCHIKGDSDFDVKLSSWFLYKVSHDHKSLRECNVWESSLLKK